MVIEVESKMEEFNEHIHQELNTLAKEDVEDMLDTFEENFERRFGKDIEQR